MAAILPRVRWVKPEQYGWHITENTFKYILLTEDCCTFTVIVISLKCVPSDSADNK